MMGVVSNDLFINLIQNNPIIYDKKSKDFKNTLKKDRVWNTIAQESFMTGKLLKLNSEPKYMLIVFSGRCKEAICFSSTEI